MNEPITWAIVVAILGLTGWIGKVARAFGLIESGVEEAKRIAESAKEEAKRAASSVKDENHDFSTGLAALNVSFHLFQVNAAEKYITRDILKEFEERLSESRRETTEAIRGDIRELRTRLEQLSRPTARRTK
jgi:hypothetical protein